VEIDLVIRDAEKIALTRFDWNSDGHETSVSQIPPRQSLL
jgi:hypothetical protein